MASSYHHGNLRAALLAEASSMLAEGGPAAVTLRALAEKTGVSRTAPYRHFDSKDALLEAVAAEGFARLQTLIRKLADGIPDNATPADMRAHFERVGAAYVRFADRYPQHYRLMYGSNALARAEHPALHDAAESAYDGLVALIQGAQALGALRPDPPAEQMAYAAWGLVHGLASLLVDGQIERPADVEAFARSGLRALLDGLAPPKPS